MRFGPRIARRLGRDRPEAHPQRHLDEMYISMGGRWMYLWREIDQDGEVLDFLVSAERDKKAALRLIRKLLMRNGFAPRTIVTDKWRAYGAAFRDLGLTARHHQAKWKNNRIEGSHVRVRRRERAMQGFRSPGSAQRFLAIHAANRCRATENKGISLVARMEPRLCLVQSGRCLGRVCFRIGVGGRRRGT
jgi:transposase-like protein